MVQSVIIAFRVQSETGNSILKPLFLSFSFFSPFPTLCVCAHIKKKALDTGMRNESSRPSFTHEDSTYKARQERNQEKRKGEKVFLVNDGGEREKTKTSLGLVWIDNSDRERERDVGE